MSPIERGQNLKIHENVINQSLNHAFRANGRILEEYSPANLDVATQDYDPLPLLELDLSHNSLSTLQRTAFVHLTNLEVLDLSGNPIEEVTRWKS